MDSNPKRCCSTCGSPGTNNRYCPMRTGVPHEKHPLAAKRMRQQTHQTHQQNQQKQQPVEKRSRRQQPQQRQQQIQMQQQQQIQMQQQQQIQQLAELHKRPTYNLKTMRQAAQLADKLSFGDCRKHPLNGYLKFDYDPSIDYSKAVKSYKFNDKGTVQEKRAKLASVRNGVYNFIIFADHAQKDFRLVLTYMNPHEYFTKHKNMLYHTKDVDLESFAYSGEIEFNGTNNLKLHDTSSLYFSHLQPLVIRVAIDNLFTVDSFKAALAASNPMYLDRFNREFPDQSGTVSSILGNRMVWYLGRSGLNAVVDPELRNMFMTYMTYALRKIFGAGVSLTYDDKIYEKSSQRTLTVDFMDDICSSKNPDEYGPLFSDDKCTNVIPDETWCTYKSRR